MMMEFRVGERVQYYRWLATIVEINNDTALVYPDGWYDSRWADFEEITSIDDLAALQAENERLREALEMFAGVWDEWLLVRHQPSHQIMGFAHWYTESWLDSNDERAFERARKALGGE